MWSLLPVCRENLALDLDLLAVACLRFRRTALSTRESQPDLEGGLDADTGADLAEIFDQVPSIADQVASA